MDVSVTKNAGRFTGFADIYDQARPAMPFYPVKIIRAYLGKKPQRVVDLGCGTGLSSLVWKGQCEELTGIEPSDDMLAVAQMKATEGISFRKGFSGATGLENASVDAVVCSQSFHWMEPEPTLAEVNRILKPGGVFAAVDCDWPPVCHWQAEKAYTELFRKVLDIEETNPDVRDSFVRWSKEGHLANIRQSGFFSYAREIVFSNTEKCTSERLIELAKSQGGLQTILKKSPELIAKHVKVFEELVYATFGPDEFDIDFGYRMRIGVK